VSNQAKDKKAKWKQVQIIIDEATGKRIRQLTVEGPAESDLNDFAVCLSCDDDTYIFIKLSSLLRVDVSYDRTIDGELQTVKEYPKRMLE
jgi:hypothetical protein